MWGAMASRRRERRIWIVSRRQGYVSRTTSAALRSAAPPVRRSGQAVTRTRTAWSGYRIPAFRTSITRTSATLPRYWTRQDTRPTSLASSTSLPHQRDAGSRRSTGWRRAGRLPTRSADSSRRERGRGHPYTSRSGSLRHTGRFCIRTWRGWIRQRSLCHPTCRISRRYAKTSRLSKRRSRLRTRLSGRSLKPWTDPGWETIRSSSSRSITASPSHAPR